MVLCTYIVYNTVVRLCHFFCCGGKVLLRPEKKKIQSSVRCELSGHYSLRLSNCQCAIIITTGKFSSGRLSGGCVIVITTRKKIDTVVCLAGARSLLRPEKKNSSCLSGDCRVFYGKLIILFFVRFIEEGQNIWEDNDNHR